MRTVTVAGMTAAIRRLSACWVVPAAAAIEISSSLPSFPTASCASGSVRTATLAPPNDATSPSFAIPVMR